MFSYIWIAILTMWCMSWLGWIYMSNHTRVHPPLPPGPLGLPVIGSLHRFFGTELNSYFADLTKTYGPLVSLRLGKKIGIVVASPSIAKEILKDNGVTFANHVVPAAGKESNYGGFGIAWSRYGPKWMMIRKVCMREMLGCANLNATYNVRKHEIHQTMLYFQEEAGNDVNIGDQMFLTAMNVVTSMMWGGTVKGEDRAKLGADLRSLVTEVIGLIGAPNVSDFFPELERFDLQGIVKRMRGFKMKLDDIFEAVINRRKKMQTFEGGKKDFLQAMMDLVKESSESSGDSNTIPFTIFHLKALLMEMIVAGTDTTSSTLEFAMSEMVNKPEVMRRAQQELDSVLGSSNESMEESHILQLPYLQAIMKETLRLHPAVPLLIPHYPSESCVVGGYTIPKESRIFVNVLAIHRDPSVWEDPLEFKPERFVDGSYDFSGNNLAYFPFGSGRRNCAGIGLAERTFLYTLAYMLRYFDWKLPKGADKLDLEEKFGIAMKKRTPLSLIPSPRLSNLVQLDSS